MKKRKKTLFLSRKKKKEKLFVKQYYKSHQELLKHSYPLTYLSLGNQPEEISQMKEKAIAIKICTAELFIIEENGEPLKVTYMRVVIIQSIIDWNIVQ